MSERVKAEMEKVDGTEKPEQRPARRVLRPQYCRSYAKRRVAEALPVITDALLDKAKKGSIQHAKVLMQLSGLDVKEDPKNARPRGKSAARELLKALRRKQEE